jgi:protein SCO1/2
MKGRLYALRFLGLAGLVFTGVIIYYTIGSGKPRSFWKDMLRPEVNLYREPGVFINQKGQSVSLQSFVGRPAIFSFVYLKCRLSCPVIMYELKKMRQRLNHEAHYIVFLFDVERQKPADVAGFFENYAIKPEDWTLLQARPEDLAVIAAKFELQYEEAGAGRFEYMHTNFFAVADSTGKVVLQIRGFEKDSEEFARKVEAALE